MKVEAEFTKKGRVFFNILFFAMISPAIFLIRADLLIFGILQISSLIIVYFFVINFPNLKRFKLIYFVTQIVGFVLGCTAYLDPSYIVPAVLINLIMYLVFIGKFIEVAKILSSKSV